MSIAIILVVSITGVLGYRYYRIFLLKNNLEKLLGRDSGHMEIFLRVESEPSNITYPELFKLYDSSVEERNKLIIELRALYPDIEFEPKEKFIDFLNTENKLVRAKKSFYQKESRFMSALDSIKVEIFDAYILRPRTEDMDDSLHSSLSRLYLYLLISDISEEGEKFTSLYRKLVEQETELAREMEMARISFRQVLTEYERDNIGLVQPFTGMDGWKFLLEENERNNIGLVQSIKDSIQVVRDRLK